MYLGVDYYPEHWPENKMDEDLDMISELGANIIRIGEFAWHLMEKTEGEFSFSFFDRVIAKAKVRNLKVMFGTPTATFPAWLAHKDPSILSENEDGTVNVFGGRRQYCYNSVTYRKYASRITEKLVSHYRDEDAIIAWQIDNEFGHEGSDMCYCSQCHQQFQLYLSEKYRSVDKLNDAYGTIFWGQTYNQFKEIPVPKKTITQHNPALLLDWARFRSHSLNSFAKEMTEILKKFKGVKQETTTNVSGGFFNKWFNHEENLEQMDFVSYDNYPVWGGLDEPVHPAETAMSLDFNRGLKNKNFWIVEELMGMQGHTVIGYMPRPGEAKMWSYQAFAHGCENMLYFRWRSMTRGAEQFCYGIVDHDNTKGRKYEEVKKVFQDISQYEKVLKEPIQSKVAIVYDYDNIWSWRFQPQSKTFDFKDELLRLYKPFFEKNVQIDVIPTSRDFSRYEIILVPVLQIIDVQLSKRFEEFASNGGTVIFSFRTGLKDTNNNVHFNSKLPGYVKEMCGIEISDSEPLSKPLKLLASNKEYVEGSAAVWRDLIKPVSAEILFSYDDELLPATAITVNKFGEGEVYYIGCGADEGTLESISEKVLNDKNIWFLPTEKGLEVYCRYYNGKNYYFIMNHTSNKKTLNGKEIQPFESMVVEEI